LRLYTLVFIITFIAAVLLFALVIYIIAQNYQKTRISECNISKLEVKSQNLRLLVDAADAVRRCRLTPGVTRVERDKFQRLRLNYDEPLSNCHKFERLRLN